MQTIFCLKEQTENSFILSNKKYVKIQPPNDLSFIFLYAQRRSS